MKRTPHTQGVFVLMLYLIFASLTLLVTATAASVYENITTAMDENNGIRTSLSYISTKLRQAETVEIENGTLVIGEGGYESVIYYHDGNIMEIYTEKDTDFAPSDGDKIIEADGLEFTEDGAMHHAFIRQNGRSYRLDWGLS